MKARKIVFANGVFLALLFYPLAFAFPQAPIYQGKTITIIQAREPGGTGDMRVRALIPFLQKYIPGNPTILSEYMAGGGGRKAANHMYRAARPDGLTIGNIGAGLVSNAILGEPGVQYDVDKFIHLGSGNSNTSYLFFTRSEIRSLEQLRSARGVRIGGQSVGHDNYIVARLFAWLFDLKDPKFVTGYSGPEMDAALLRGELDARANSSETVGQRNSDWLEKGPVQFHAVMEIPLGFRFPHTALTHLPALDAYVKSDREKKVLHMFRLFRLMGSPYILPPGTSKERVEILQEAFRKAFRDPEFSASMKKMTATEAYPLMPEAQESAVREIPRDREVIEIFNQVAGGGPLPSR